MFLYFDWKYQTKCNKLSSWKFCEKSTSHDVSILLTDLPQSLLQSALDCIHIPMDETVPGAILWHNYFTIFQFKVSWGLCCSPPEWDLPIVKLRKWHSFSAWWEGMQEHWRVRKSAGIPLEGCTVDGLKSQSCPYCPLEIALGKCYSVNLAQRFSQGMLLGMDINHTDECANN